MRMRIKNFIGCKRLLLITLMTLFISSLLSGCSKSFTKSYTLDIETGDSIKITMDAAKGYVLDKNEKGFYCIKNKNDESLQCTMSFYVPDVYIQYGIQLALEGCSTKTTSKLIKDTKTELHVLTYDGDSIALFWIPDAGVGIYLYSENDDTMEKLDDVIDMMTIELVKAGSSGSTDPFDMIQQQINSTVSNEVSSTTSNNTEVGNIISNSTEVPDRNVILDNTDTPDRNIMSNNAELPENTMSNNTELPENIISNSTETSTNYQTNSKNYWKVPYGFAEIYNGDFFVSYEKDDKIAVTAYYEADEYDLEVLETGKYSYYDFDSVNVWQSGSLYFVEAEKMRIYRYECMTKDGSIYLKIQNSDGKSFTRDEVESIAYSFLN